jgi:hypothetical protein
MQPQTETETNGPPDIYKCQGCPCIFLTKQDLQKHLNAFKPRDHTEQYKTLHKKAEHNEDPETETKNTWYPSKYGGKEELMLAEKDLDLANKLRQTGTLFMGTYMYKLNGKWIIRTRI